MDYMSYAMQLANTLAYAPHPNPRVGCVLVKDNCVVGTGFHAYAGGPHAEVVAIAQAKEKAFGATCYVTLEPCAHTGKTGPCIEALQKAGIHKVVIGQIDPNPVVRGKGVAALRKASIDVSIEPFASQSMNKGFLKRQQTGLPYVRLKMAQSLDGKVALKNGMSQWITSEASRLDVQCLRFQSDVIITGIGTLLADNPQLNVRDDFLLSSVPPQIQYKQPLRVILDRQLQSTPDLKIFESTLNSPVWIFANKSSVLEKQHFFKDLPHVEIKPIEVDGLNGSDGQNDSGLKYILKCLASMQYQEVLVECGPTLASAFMKEDCVDELVVYMAPKLLGHESSSFLHMPQPTNLEVVPKFTLISMQSIGDDIRLNYQVQEQVCDQDLTVDATKGEASCLLG